MYTSLEDAKEELRRRWNDVHLRHEVMEYVGEVPEALRAGPKAVFYRSLITPNFECQMFVETAKCCGLDPLFMEYQEDKFCVSNPCKLALGKLTFFHGKGRNDGNRISVQKVLDFNGSSGKRINQLDTRLGIDLVTLHKLLAQPICSGSLCFDMGRWFKERGDSASEYYHRYLSLFVCNAVLFENFSPHGNEGSFTTQVAQPSFAKITEHFGLRPLIVPLLPQETEDAPHWNWYPGHYEKIVASIVSKV